MATESAGRFEFRCESCGELHSGSPSFGYAEPPGVLAIPEAERPARVRLKADTCIIDDDEYFIRGILELPIRGIAEPFLWGVWVSQSRESFDRYVATIGQDQSEDGSFGWLEVTMPGYRDVDERGKRTFLACDVRWGKPGMRPLVEPHPCDHILYREFTEGMTWDRAVELATMVMHG